MLCLHSNFQCLVFSTCREIGGTELHTHKHDDYRMPLWLCPPRHKYILHVVLTLNTSVYNHLRESHISVNPHQDVGWLQPGFKLQCGRAFRQAPTLGIPIATHKTEGPTTAWSSWESE